MIGALLPILMVTVQAAAPVFPQQGAIGMVPPTGMTESASFAGFEDKATGASITLAELPPQAFAELIERIDTAGGGKLPGGVKLSDDGTPLTLTDGTPARLYRGEQASGGALHAKWLLVVNGATATAIVTTQVPQASAAATAPAVEAALRTVRLRGAAELEMAIAALPFAVGDRAGFRPVRTLMGSGLILTDGPLDVDTEGAQPVVIVANSLGAAPVADRAGHARTLFEATADLTRLKIDGEGASPDSTMLTGTAVDRARYIRIRQHVRYGGRGGYVRIVCIAPVADDIAARCDRLARSVAVR